MTMLTICLSRLLDRDLHALYTGTFPRHADQARGEGMACAPTPWAVYPINKASTTDEEAEVGTENEDDAEIVPNGDEPSPENNNSEGEDEDNGEGGGGDEDEDKGRTRTQGVQRLVPSNDGEMYNDDNEQDASL
jgi:hypothetical protein